MDYGEKLHELYHAHKFYSLNPIYGGSCNPDAEEIGSRLFQEILYFEKEQDCEEHY